MFTFLENIFKTPEEIHDGKVKKIWDDGMVDHVVSGLQTALNAVMRRSGDHILERVLYHIDECTSAGLQGKHTIKVHGSPVEFNFSTEGYLKGIKIIKKLPFVEIKNNY